MAAQNLNKRRFAFVTLLAIACAFAWWQITECSGRTQGVVDAGDPNLQSYRGDLSLEIFFIDVNHGDATLLVSSTGKTLLIDSGTKGCGQTIANLLESFGIDGIDYFVATHYHSDHLGGIDELVRLGIPVRTAFDRGARDSLSLAKQAERSYSDYIDSVGKEAITLRPGDVVEIEPSLLVRCLAAGGDVFGDNKLTVGLDENDNSLALQIEMGDFCLFVGGDLGHHTEGLLVQSSQLSQADIYQVNHHGSDTSSSKSFLERIKPLVAVISNGNHGGYQHPRKSVIDRLEALFPPPHVYQTNKYLKGGHGGNVSDARIGDLAPVAQRGQSKSKFIQHLT